jgi:hypothetical protein
LFAFRTFINPEAANYKISVIEAATQLPVVAPVEVEPVSTTTPSGTSSVQRGGQPLNTRP